MISFLIGGGLMTTSFFTKFNNVINIRMGHHLWFIFLMMLLIVSIEDKKLKITDLFLLYFLPASFLLSPMFFSKWTFFQWLATSLGIIGFIKLKSIYIDRKFLTKLFASMCLLQSMWIILDYFNFDIYGVAFGLFGDVQKLTDTGKDWEIVHGKAITGSLGHPLLSASYVAILLPFVYKFKKYLAIIPITALSLTGSAMGIITAYVATLYIITHRFRFRVHLLFIHIIGLFCLGYHGYKNGGFFSDSARLINWQAMIAKHWSKSPFFGNGPGFLGNQNFKIPGGTEIFRPEHNEILTLYFQYGLMGLALIAIYSKIILVNFTKEKDFYFKGAIVAFLFNCLGSFPLHIASLSFIFIILISQLNKEQYNGSIS